MSVFGVIVCLFLIFRFIEIALLKTRKMQKTFLITDMMLLLILIIQLIFIFNEGFSLYQLLRFKLSSFLYLIIATALAVSVINIHLKYNNLIAKVILVVFVAFGLIYTEHFNGIFSFNKYNDFFAYSRPLKSYYNIFPYKIVKQQTTPEINSEAEANVYSGIMFYPIAIKKDAQGDIYYYVPRGFGENGNWFRYGVPEGQQV